VPRCFRDSNVVLHARGSVDLAFSIGVAKLHATTEQQLCGWARACSHSAMAGNGAGSYDGCFSSSDCSPLSWTCHDDVDSCSDYLKPQTGLNRNSELLSILREVFVFLSEQQLLHKQRSDSDSRLPPAAWLESLDDHASHFRRQEVRSCFTPSMALGLQHYLLEAYQTEAFAQSCQDLVEEWNIRVPPPMLEVKMEEITRLCLKRVLSRILPDEHGIEEMKAAMTQHSKANPMVTQIHITISMSVMARFPL